VWETCRPAVATNPIPNSAIRATVDTRLVRPMASPVVAVSTPSASSVLTFTTVPAADPNGVRWLTKKLAKVTSAVGRNRTGAPRAARTCR
jgi:hypothetical protein